VNTENVNHAATVYQQALALHRQGRIREARAGYERVLAVRPEEVSALTMLGVIALETGDAATAVGFLDRAAAAGATGAMVHIHRGTACCLLNQHQAAAACFEKAIEIDPASASLAYYHRGNVLLRVSQFEPAISSYEQVIAIGSDIAAEAYFERGVALLRLGRNEAAIESFDCAITRRSRRATDAHYERGNALRSLGRSEAARASFEQALRANPAHPHARHALGRLHHDLANFDAALDAYMAACRAKPDLPEAFLSAGQLLWELGRIEEAEAILRRGLEHSPASSSLYNALGIVLAAGGDIAEALPCYRQALALAPDAVATHSNLAFSLMFTSESHEPLLTECRRFNDRFATNLAADTGDPRHPRRAPSNGARLRIGYVSPDFRDHCQSLFTLPLFRNHDRSEFEIICYSSARESDDVTRRIAQEVDALKDVRALDDAALAGLMHADQIDVLVDLTMHMANGRPLLFARRPAPVQVTWLAYPGTTGLNGIDYRFSDPRLDPPGFDSHYTERTIRLPDAFWCYDPMSVLTPAQPARRRDELTLGCLNNPSKLTDRTLRLWAPVLEKLPKARLLLLAPAGQNRDRIMGRASAAGIDTKRVQFVVHRPREEYLNYYRDIDFCLDTFPYNGHTTSLDALWMGVPFVTRIGHTSVGRGGLSLLYQLGMTELAVESDEEFLAVALALAADRSRLESLRLELRPRLARSPLMDGRRFARNIELAYREICSG
jgi:protein O-GlcNAc transferase